MNKPTQQYLKEKLNYFPESGIFTWENPNCSRIKRGDLAGSKGSHGYIQIILDWSPYLAQWLAWLYMTGNWPEKSIDHINGVRDDNRWENLRLCSVSENHFNEKISKNNTSGVKGVCWDKSRGKWVVHLHVNYKQIYLGRYDDLETAKCVIREKRTELHKDFANHG